MDFPEHWPQIVDWFTLDGNDKQKYLLYFLNGELVGCMEESMDDLWKESVLREEQVLSNGRIEYRLK